MDEMNMTTFMATTDMDTEKTTNVGMTTMTGVVSSNTTVDAVSALIDIVTNMTDVVANTNTDSITNVTENPFMNETHYISSALSNLTTMGVTTSNVTLFNSAGATAEPVVEWLWDDVAWEWWQIIELILAVVGIAGNFLVMLVLFRPGVKRQSTDTLIAGLAVADFLTSIFVIPVPRVVTLPDTFIAQFYCRVIYSSVIMWISICASIFTLTIISLERMLAIRFPFLFQRLFTARRSSIAILIMWFASFVINTNSFYVTFIEDGRCVVRYPAPWLHVFTGVGLFLVEYLLPVVVMVLAHVLTIRSLRVSQHSLTQGKEQEKHALRLLTARRRLTQMLLVVVVTFVVCWTPDQFAFLLFNIGVVGVEHLYSPLYLSFIVLAFFNSCVNPIIYAMRNPKFRRAVKEIFSAVPRRGVQNVFGGEEGNTITETTNVPSYDQSKV